MKRSAADSSCQTVDLTREEVPTQILMSQPLGNSSSAEDAAKAKELRICAKTFHLTYKTHIDHKKLLEHLRQVCSSEMKWWSVVWETGHSVGTPYDHTHVAFQLMKRLQTRLSNKFDLDGIHPNVQLLNSKEHIKHVWEYHLKDPLLLTQSEYSPVQMTSFYQSIINASCLVDAIKVAGVEVRSVMDVRAIRMDKSRLQEIPPLSNAYSWTLTAPGAWHALFLTGRTGTGKTRWALDQFEHPLLVSMLEDLKTYMPDLHDGLVFDDFSMRKLQATEVIHLLDWELPRTINVKHGSVTIPAETKKIFTSNLSFAECLPDDVNPAVMQAISRRINIIHVNGPTFNKLERIARGPDLVTLDILAVSSTADPSEDGQSASTSQTDWDGMLDMLEMGTKHPCPDFDLDDEYTEQ